MTSTVPVTRILPGDDGRSYFEDMDVTCDDAGRIGAMSELWSGPGTWFRTVDGDYDWSWHTAPQRQLIVNLTGSVEITVGSGETRVFGPGAVMLVEDVTGQGHISRNVDGEPRTCVIMPLDDGVPA